MLGARICTHPQGLQHAAPALGGACAPPSAAAAAAAQDLGSQRAAERFLERAQNKHGFGLIAVSLGYAETLLSVSGASTSSELSPAERAAAGARQPYPSPRAQHPRCQSSPWTAEAGF